VSWHIESDFVNKCLLDHGVARKKYAVSIFSFQGSANAEAWPTHITFHQTCKSAGSDVIREICFYFAYSVQDINRQWRHEKDSSREANSCSGSPVMELLLRYRCQPVAGNFHTLTFCLFKNQFSAVHFFLIPLMRATCPVHPLFLTLLNLTTLVEEWTIQISFKIRVLCRVKSCSSSGQTNSILPWRWRQQDSRKSRGISDRIHSVTNQKAVILTITRKCQISHIRLFMIQFFQSTHRFQRYPQHVQHNLCQMWSLIVWSGFRLRLAWQVSTKSSGELAGFIFRAWVPHP
jgi:hypothetical protein